MYPWMIEWLEVSREHFRVDICAIQKSKPNPPVSVLPECELEVHTAVAITTGHVSHSSIAGPVQTHKLI
jgi:hypothetical protein